MPKLSKSTTYKVQNPGLISFAVYIASRINSNLDPFSTVKKLLIRFQRSFDVKQPIRIITRTISTYIYAYYRTSIETLKTTRFEITWRVSITATSSGPFSRPPGELTPVQECSQPGSKLLEASLYLRLRWRQGFRLRIPPARCTYGRLINRVQSS